MGLMRTVLLWGSRSKWLDEQFRRRQFARKAVARFMPGEEIDDALKAAEDCKANGMSTIVTKLGENLTDLREADVVAKHYLDVLDKIAQRGLDTHISVKLTQLGLDLDREAALKHLQTLAQHAAGKKNFV